MLKQNQISSQIIFKKNVRGPDSPPVARFEKLNPAKQRFYFDVRRVYSDGTEFSFEELMGRKWLQAKEKQEEKLRTQRLEAEVLELKQQLQELMKQKSARKPLVERNSTNRQRRPHNQDDDIIAGSVSGSEKSGRSDLWNGTLAATETINLPVPDKKPAFTIYTEETEKVASPNVSQKPSAIPKKAPGFEIFVEETEPVVVPSKLRGAAIPQKKPDFPIFVEETEPVAVASEQISSIPQKAPGFPIFVEETEQIAEHAKNVAAASVVSSKKPAVTKMTKTPLQVISLEQPRKSDVRRMSQDEFFDFSVHPMSGDAADMNGMTFMLPTCETEFISKNSRGASTPAAFGPKKHINRLVTKQPEPEETFGGGVTAKLSPIVETSREYKSSSSSSGSSGAQTTRGLSTASAFNFTQKRSRFLSSGGKEEINPFDEELIVELLDNIAEPLEKRKGFYFTNRNMPKMKENSTVIKLGNDKYIVGRLIDTGAFAKVYAAQIDCAYIDDTTGVTTALSEAGCNKWFALKVCQPANVWEFYICDELHKRLARSSGPDIEISVMIANPAILFINGSILVDEFCSNGTLIKVINLLKKKNKVLPKSMISFFALELLLILRQIHSCEIIHGDVKPDNVLVQNFPSRDEVLGVSKRTTCLKLIDFGRGIDRKAFATGTTFNYCVQTRGSQCPEMRDGRPWTTHTDWFGFLDCLHVMIFGDYVSISKEANGRWAFDRKFNKRNHLKEIWEPLCDGLLNMESEQPTCVDDAIVQLDKWIAEHIDEVCKDGLELDLVFESAK